MKKNKEKLRNLINKIAIKIATMEANTACPYVKIF